MGLKTGVFTIASKNYLAYVRVLLRSMEQVHPEYERFLCLADKVDGCFEPAREPYRLVEVDRLGIAALADMALRYDIMEFNTAVKPYMIQWLFKHTDLDVVIYLDPDIRAYSRFVAIEREFAAGASVVLTPHITRPLEDGKDPHDHHMLQAGVFNLGFVAVRRCAEAESFVAWWARRLATQAVADVRNNLFTDQRWCDLAPCFLDRLAILKAPGYNAAYWNLAERTMSRAPDGSWRANGQPLAFFHFSGVNVDRPQIVSKHQNRFSWDNIPHCRPLFDDYLARLREEGSGEAKGWPYAYASVDGLTVSTIMRLLYRSAHEQPAKLAASETGHHLVALSNEVAAIPPCTGAPTITRLMHLIYTLRPDLQAAFSLATAAGRQQFVGWFHAAAKGEYALPDAVIPPPEPMPEVPPAPAPAPAATVNPFPALGVDAGAAAASNLVETLAPVWSALSPELRRLAAPVLHGLLTLRATSALAAAASTGALPVSTPQVPQAPAGKKVRSIKALQLEADIPQLLDRTYISRLMYILWKSRSDLQAAFDLSSAGGQQGFANWFVASAESEYGLEGAQPAAVPDKNLDVTLSMDRLGGSDGANLVGYARAELGMGEHVRMTAAALASTDIPYGIVNFAVQMQSRQEATVQHGELIDRNRHKANIFHVNADQMVRAYCRLGADFFVDRYNIGYWAWELARCPAPWVPITEMVNEIWAPSVFIQQAFAQVTNIPVVHMPLCVAPGEPATLERSHFKLPRDAFLFLYVFDFLSFLERKNPTAAIRAFHSAFGRDNQAVGLVLKVMNADPASPAWLRMIELMDGDTRIVIIVQTMSRPEVLGLFKTCDSFLSLHRSEGFGRGPAEAMYLGKPVVATNYSGNTDFTRPDNSCPVNYRLIPVDPQDYPMADGQVWADADVEHAAWYMRRLATDANYARETGQRGCRLIREEFSEQAIGRLYARRLRAIGVA